MPDVSKDTVEIVRVKVRPLTREGMKLYGDVLDEDHPIFPQVDRGRGAVAMEINTLKRNDSARQTLDQLAIHGSYTQSFIILQGSMVMVYAPAPANLDGDPELMPLDYDRLGAFILNAGDAAHINRGVWHGSVVIGGFCRFVNVTRKDEGEGTTNVAEVDDENLEYSRHYIELVNVRRRDKRQIVLDL
jgi:ureidoglycolate hydrolase